MVGADNLSQHTLQKPVESTAPLVDPFGQLWSEKLNALEQVLTALPFSVQDATDLLQALQQSVAPASEAASPSQLVLLLQQFNRLEQVLLDAKEGTPAQESVRNFVVAIATDLRVIYCALAQQIVSLRFLYRQPHDKALTYAQMALNVFAPLANRLGLWQLKWQLEDAAFRLIEPSAYKEIAAALAMKREARKQTIEQLMHDMGALLQQHQFDYQLSGRAKHIYSIWQKIKKKKKPLTALTDLLAMRIVVDSVDACYRVLSLIQAGWPCEQSEYTDYISKPKANGYQSLHIVLRLNDQRPVEVQIRTQEMHQRAEAGIAAHWHYKEHSAGRAKQLLAELIAWRSSLDQLELKAARSTSVAQFIYVLTPQGRVLELAAGATPIDFAYALHSDIGHRCKGALVDGAIVPLNHRLGNGQLIEILTHKTPNPSRDWLQDSYTASRRAKNKIRAWFNQLDRTQTENQGREQVLRILQKEGKTTVKLERLAQQLGFDNEHDFFWSWGKGEGNLQAVLDCLHPPSVTPPAQTPTIPAGNKARTAPAITHSKVLVAGVSGLRCSAAACCRPVPGEAVAGFITRLDGIRLHRAGCSNLQHLRQRLPERITPIDWQRLQGNTFSVALSIFVQRAPTMALLEFLQKGLSANSSGSKSPRAQYELSTACVQVTLQVPHIDDLNQWIAQVNRYPEVLRVVRH